MYSQEEYVKEGIKWENIEFIDNTGCLDLFSKRPTGLLQLLDEECKYVTHVDQSALVGSCHYSVAAALIDTARVQCGRLVHTEVVSERLARAARHES